MRVTECPKYSGFFASILLFALIDGIYCQSLTCDPQTPVLQVNENTPTDTAIITCNAPVGAEVTVTNNDNTAPQLTAISTSDTIWEIHFITEPDYENSPQQWTITVTDTIDQTPVPYTILLFDVNDKAPVFIGSTVTLSIEENMASDNITQLSVTDDDGTDQYNAHSVSFSFAGTNTDYDGRFALSDTSYSDSVMSVCIQLIIPLDCEKGISYSLIVLAKDSGNLNSSMSVIVNCQDVEDEPPHFNQIMTYVNIPEDLPIASYVLQVSAVDGDQVPLHSIKYEISAGNDDGNFDIDQTGTVTVKKKLDRDQGEGLYTLTLTASEEDVTPDSDEPYQTNTTSTIVLDDVNDCAPTFSKIVYEGTIPENSPVNYYLTFDLSNQLLVTDADQQKDYASFGVSLIDPQNIFEVTPESGVGQQTFSIFVSNSAPLDYETIQSYNLTITAIDSSDSTLVSSATITVNILDVDDQKPIFTSTKCTDTPEDAKMGQRLCTIVAISKDDAFPDIVYTGSFGTLDSLIEIDSVTGVITVSSTSPFDYESDNIYALTVIATNSAGLSNSTSTQLKITDVNDNSPEFQSEEYQMVLYENHDSFTVPLFVQATDKDSGINANIVFSLTKGGENFALVGEPSPTSNGYSQEIAPIGTLDFEALDSGCISPSEGCPLYLEVTATDQGSPPLTATVNVTITLMDENDMSPEFEVPIYEGSCTETDEAGTLIGVTVSAADGDATIEYSSFKYRIENDGISNFQISDDGVITIAPSANLNPNLYNPPKYTYNLTVYADDNGGHAGQCSVIVTVKDVDNNPPQFVNKTTFKCDIPENNSDIGIFYSVTATDIDQNPILVYSIDFAASFATDERNNEVDVVLQDYFDINPDKGNLSLKNAVDREAMTYVTLQLVVTDTNTDASSDGSTDTASLPITIKDINDCLPQFSQTIYYGSIKENSKNVIVNIQDSTISATDADLNSVIEFSIDAESSSDFTISSSTGTTCMLSANENADLDYEATPCVNVTILATDMDSYNWTSAIVIISLINQNDVEPAFSNSSTNFTFPENENGTIGASVYAIDNDIDGSVSYQFETYSPQFDINDSTGEITVKNPLDYETDPKTYVLNVVAVDNYIEDDTTRHTVKTTVTMILTPINEFSPVFSPLPSCSIDEDADNGAFVCQLRATDEDQGDGDGDVHFLQEDITSTTVFAISSDGKITLSGDIFNQPGEYTVSVQACDNGNPEQMCSELQTVPITVKDVNNNAPEILYPTYDHVEYYRADNCTKINVPILNVTYEDLDKDSPNQDSTYTLTSTCTLGILENQTVDYFAINPTGGIYPTVDELHRSECGAYELSVTVINVAYPYYQDNVNFSLTLSYCSDSPPVFPETAPNCSMTENCDNNCPPCQIPQPIDVDDMYNDTKSPIYCYFTSDNADYSTELFDIDQTSCIVFYNKDQQQVLDYEAHKQHILYLYASHDILSSTPPYEDKEGFAVLTITVKDINDVPPYFLQSDYHGGVSYDDDYGYVITTLTADDIDSVDIPDDLTFGMDMDSVHITNKANMGSVPNDCISVDESTGNVILKYGFDDGMTGYIEFEALVFDSNKTHSNTTNVKIYVVSSDEMLVCSTTNSIADFQNMSHSFENDFSAVTTGYSIVVDGVKAHLSSDGSVIAGECDVYIHMIDSVYNILDADEAMKVVGQYYDDLATSVFSVYGVFTIQSYIVTATESNEDVSKYVLIAISAVLAVICIALIFLSIYNSRRMKRKLKAATAPAFGSQTSGLNRIEVPNSNLHAIEGSNPIWNAETNMKMEVGNDYDETNDNDSIISSIRDKHQFEGGVNNPTFEDRMENYFNQEEDADYDKRSRNSEEFRFGDENQIDFSNEFSFGAQTFESDDRPNSSFPEY